MVAPVPNIESQSDTHAWGELQRLVAEVAERARSTVDATTFYTKLLDCAVQALAAAGGAVWIVDPSDGIVLCRQTNCPEEFSDNGRPTDRHSQLLESVLRRREAAIIAPAGKGTAHTQRENPTDLLLLLCPIWVDDTPCGVLEILQRPHASPATQQGYLQFLSGLCDVAGDFHRQTELRALRSREAGWRELYQFSVAVHENFDLSGTASMVVNEARRMVDADRVSVLEVRRARARILSVSGVDTVQTRSNLLRRLETLVEAVTAADEPLWHVEGSGEQPPEIERPLRDYLDLAHSRSVAILPLHRSSAPRTAKSRTKTVAALVIERMDGRNWDDAQRRHVANVAGLSQSALGAAIAMRDLPLSWLGRSLHRVGGEIELRTLYRRLIITGICIVGTIGLGFLPARFQIEAGGELQPMVQRQVFAATDGEVESLHVRHAEPCAAGDVLLTLRNSELELDLRRINGELQTTQTRLAASRAAMLAIDRAQPDAIARFNQLTAEEQELKETLVSQERQLEILNDERTKLKVRSPIDGRVLTWNVDELLRSRPVRRGQALLSVADVEGPWHLEIHVPERHVGHVLAAQQAIDPKLGVSYILQSDPGNSHTGHLEEVALATTFDDREGDSVTITAEIDTPEAAELRPGAYVRAKIDCGRKPLAYVWLHDLYAAVQRWIMF
jgi:multidrug efflux pump subunit AcrA (membrane-fusion protein)